MWPRKYARTGDSVLAVDDVCAGGRTLDVGGGRSRAVEVPFAPSANFPSLRHASLTDPLLLLLWIPWHVDLSLLSAPRGQGGLRARPSPRGRTSCLRRGPASCHLRGLAHSGRIGGGCPAGSKISAGQRGRWRRGAGERTIEVPARNRLSRICWLPGCAIPPR